jgi:hypothetical protein
MEYHETTVQYPVFDDDASDVLEELISPMPKRRNSATFLHDSGEAVSEQGIANISLARICFPKSADSDSDYDSGYDTDRTIAASCLPDVWISADLPTPADPSNTNPVGSTRSPENEGNILPFISSTFHPNPDGSWDKEASAVTDAMLALTHAFEDTHQKDKLQVALERTVEDLEGLAARLPLELTDYLALSWLKLFTFFRQVGPDQALEAFEREMGRANTEKICFAQGSFAGVVGHALFGALQSRYRRTLVRTPLRKFCKILQC